MTTSSLQKVPDIVSISSIKEASEKTLDETRPEVVPTWSSKTNLGESGNNDKWSYDQHILRKTLRFYTKSMSQACNSGRQHESNAHEVAAIINCVSSKLKEGGAAPKRVGIKIALR